MGVDTNVWLRVRDRGALREALEAYAAKDRQWWIDEGREAEYEEELADGYDPKPLMRPLPDGSVSIFTGLRFHDPDMEFAIRCWLQQHFGDALARIHDDPRGVFVSPDICESRGASYDDALRRLEGAGRFIDPSPPTEEEHEERRRASEAYSAGMAAVRAAQAAGDNEALQRALAAAPQEVRDSFARQEEMARRFEQPDRFTGAITADDDIVLSEPELEKLKRVMERMGMSIEGAPTGAALGEAFSTMFAARVEESIEEAKADPLGFGRVSMLLPPDVAKALGDTTSVDVQERVELADGSVVIVTSRMGDAVMEATSVAAALPTSFDRAKVGLLPFFRESLAAEATNERTFAAARRALGDRVELLPLQTWDERMASEKMAVADWLDEKGT